MLLRQVLRQIKVLLFLVMGLAQRKEVVVAILHLVVSHPLLAAKIILIQEVARLLLVVWRIV
jgi:hypothetical protein